MSSCSFGKKSRLQLQKNSQKSPSNAHSIKDNVQYRANPQGTFSTELIMSESRASQHSQHTWAPVEQTALDQLLDTEGIDEELSRMGGKVATIKQGVAEFFHDNLETIQYLDDFTMEIEQLSKLLERKTARNLKFENQNNAIRGPVLTTALERDIRRELEENKQRWNLVYQDEDLVPDFEHHSWKRPNGSSRAASPKQSPRNRTLIKAQIQIGYDNNTSKLQVGENEKLESIATDQIRNQAINCFNNDEKKNLNTLERKSVEVKQQLETGNSENANIFKGNSNASLGHELNLSDMSDQLPQGKPDSNEKRAKYSRSTYKANTTNNLNPGSLKGSSIIKTPEESDSTFWK